MGIGRASLLRAAVVAVLMALLVFSGSECSGFERALRLADRGTVGSGDLVEEMRRADLVFVGERHNVRGDHRAQLDVIRALHEAGADLAVGLEMFNAEDQHELYSWVKGESSAEGIRRAFARNWNYGWALYEDIFLFAREHSIPILGLNVPREITRKVSQKGFASLTPDELLKLPIPISCDVDEGYKEYIRTANKEHGRDDASFVYFCEAQLMWDKVMAWHLAEYLARNPKKTVVVLAGVNHSWKKGIPEQVRRLRPALSPLVVLPRMDVPGGTMNTGYLDYMLLE